MLLAMLVLIFLVPGQATTTVFVAIFFGMQWVASFGQVDQAAEKAEKQGGATVEQKARIKWEGPDPWGL